MLSYKNCIFNCGYCKPGQFHNCRSCGAINAHRTKDCPKTSRLVYPVQPIVMTSCVLNCGFCQPGQKHYCRSCGAIDSHLTRNCPKNKPQQQVQPLQPAFPVQQVQPLQPAFPVQHKQTFQPAFPVQHKQTFVSNVGAYIIRNNNGKSQILLCRRGVPGSMYNKIIGPGGAIDPGETADQAIIRETLEESGVDISQFINTSLSVVHHLGSTSIYIIRIGYDCVVKGAKPANSWEISKNPIVSSIPAGPSGCGWYWVDLTHAIALSKIEHGDNHWFTKNLLKCV